MKSINIEELLYLLEKQPLNIIDIRSNYEYSLSKIPTAKNIDKFLLLNAPNQYLDKNQIYYIYCQSGHTSELLVNRLNNLGYKTVNIIGGYNNYLLTK